MHLILVSIEDVEELAELKEIKLRFGEGKMSQNFKKYSVKGRALGIN